MKELREKVAQLEEKLGQKSAPIQTQKGEYKPDVMVMLGP